MSTARFIPNEILELIFLCAFDSSSPIVLDILDGTATPSDTRLAITKTCRRWRDVAYSVGALWSNLLITDGLDSSGHAPNLPVQQVNLPLRVDLPAFRPQSSVRKRLQEGTISLSTVVTMVEHWLALSRTPLTLRWDVGTKTEDEIQQACFRSLFAHTKRWRDVSIRLGMIPDSNLWPPSWYGAYCSLERLLVDIPSYLRHQFFPIMIELGPRYCPRLTDLTLGHATIHKWEIYWETLTRFSYFSNSDDRAQADLIDIFSCIDRAHSLVCLRLADIRPLHNWASLSHGLTIVTHSTLEELSLTNIISECFTTLLAKLICPRLKRLTVRLDSDKTLAAAWTPQMQASVVNFISHCTATLEHLVFDVPASHLPDVHSFLTLLPNLRTLTWPPLTTASSKLLTLRYSADGRFETGICPLLHGFRMIQKERPPMITPGAGVGPAQAYDPFLWKSIVDMLVSRMKLPVGARDTSGHPMLPIEEVELTLNVDERYLELNRPDQLRRLKALIHEGHFLTIHYTGSGTGRHRQIHV